MSEGETQSFPDSSSTSASLLDRVQSRNDQTAWNRLVTIYSPLVYRLCRVSGLSEDDAADTAQEVFAAVFRNIGNFNHDGPDTSFRGWLFTITKNKIRDLLRKRIRSANNATVAQSQAFLEQLPEITWDSSDNVSGFNPQSVILQRVVALVRGDFEEKTWQAFWRVTVEGQMPATVANQLGVSKWTVYQAKSRVLSRIRTELVQLDELPES